MTVHTTNYYNTFIAVSADTKANSGTPPPAKPNKTAAEIQYHTISSHPYQFTSDEILFNVFAEKKELLDSEIELARELFFSKGQPCFRASPLPKTYGFGIHFNEEGRVALYGMDTEKYQEMLNNDSIKKLKAMRSGK